MTRDNVIVKIKALMSRYNIALNYNEDPHSIGPMAKDIRQRLHGLLLREHGHLTESELDFVLRSVDTRRHEFEKLKEGYEGR